MRQRGKQFEFKFMKVDTKEIKAADYQRIPDMKRVKEIVSKFDWNLVNVVKVSYRDGVFWDFDGDHTVLACKEYNGGKDLCIWCKVYYGMTYEDEAYYFAMQNGSAKDPKLNETLKATQKTDERFIELGTKYKRYNGLDRKRYEHIISNAGFVVDYNGNGSVYNTPRCHQTMLDAFKANDKAFIETLNTLSICYNGSADAFDHNFVKGLFLFLDRYMDDVKFDKKRLRTVLTATTPKAFIKAVKQSMNEGKYKYARRFIAIYNFKISDSKKLIDNFV